MADGVGGGSELNCLPQPAFRGGGCSLLSQAGGGGLDCSWLPQIADGGGTYRLFADAFG